jgi:hypothetical protein
MNHERKTASSAPAFSSSFSSQHSSNRWPLNIGQRCTAADAPENTLTALVTRNPRFGLSPDIETYTITAAQNQEEIYA